MAGKKRRGKGGEGRRREQDVPNSDYLLDAAQENWPYILAAYRRFEERRPIVLYDLQERRIYVYPYPEFKEDMSERSQRSLEEQCEKAGREGKIVVFVRDNDEKRLVAFSIAPE